MSVELISGRFDPPHLGHAITLGRELIQYSQLIVVVLDDGTQQYPLTYRMEVLREVAGILGKGRIVVESNRTHFAQISRDELSAWAFDVYGSGNMHVLQHIDSLGVPCHWIPRAYEYEARFERLGRKVAQLVTQG